MKQLLAGIVLVLVIGVLGFLYRYEIENPRNTLPGVAGGAASGGVACSDDAKICPDGSAVGRTGPNCTFAVCAPPNAELTFASTTLDFVLPAGYTKDSEVSGQSSDSAQVLATYTQGGATASSSTITIRSYSIPAGETAGQLMLANTTFDPSGLTATTTTQFKNLVEGRNTFYEILIGRFEGQVQSAYYLYEPGNVLRFDITERGVQNWTDPNLDVNALPQHQSFQQMLATLQIEVGP